MCECEDWHGHVHTCASPFPRLRLPSWPGRGPILLSALSLTPTRARMCRAGREGAGVSASSCVTGLISLQPGRLGPEGSGGGGAGPHSPSDKYVFGAAVLKGHGGEEEGWSAPRAEPLGPSQAPVGSCDPLRRDETQIQGAVPLVQPGPPHPQPCAEGPAVVDAQILGLWSRQAHKPTPADAQTGSDERTKTALRATGCWTAGVQGHPFSLTPTFTQHQKNPQNTSTQECVASHKKKRSYTLHTHMHM